MNEQVLSLDDAIVAYGLFGLSFNKSFKVDVGEEKFLIISRRNQNQRKNSMTNEWIEIGLSRR